MVKIRSSNNKLLEDKKLLASDTIAAYMNRFKDMQRNRFSPSGKELFIQKVTAVSEQINNLHVRATINEFKIDNDGSEELGGSHKSPSPMESLLATLANCLEQTALLYFTVMGLKINSVKVMVEGTQDKRSSLNPKKSPFPGFYDFHITWFIDSNDDLKRIKRIVEKVKDSCPVKGTVTRSHSFSDKIVLIEDQNIKKVG